MTTRIRLDRRVRRFDGGRIVLGGAPMRVLKLSEAGARRVDQWAAGAPVGGHATDQAFLRRLVGTGIAHPASSTSTCTPDDVTIVVPVKDNHRGIDRLLPHTAQIAARIIVDDGSVPPIPAAAVRHDNSCGPAAARNSGWRLADTDLIAFLDSDTEPCHDWLEHLLPLFDDPAVAAVAPRIVSGNNGVVGPYEANRSSLDMGTDPAVVRPDGHVRYVPSAALVVRRSALTAIGGFDETLRFGEDVDLVWRLADAGYTVRYQPDSTVYHEPRQTLGAWLRQRFDYGTSAAPLAERHPRLLAAIRTPRYFAAQCALTAAGRPGLAAVIGIVAAGHSTMRLRRLGIPLRTAGALSATAQLRLIEQVGVAFRTIWWLPGLCHRRTRALALISFARVAIPALLRGRGLRWTALRALDDATYGLGVWAGCLRHRTGEPLLPTLGQPESSAQQ
ncbi:mycofactocin biosynthesis glycosyltransferase MftF [Nocardia sp. NPDC004860]|uniref:mycofactocin biosynthesis glycosyltransferase MftF n=1 Tax=Nocardia sp. NPDC004860 TaxID=3154557 RepID=UPI0033ADAB88